jgi:hypothetical protein
VSRTSLSTGDTDKLSSWSSDSGDYRYTTDQTPITKPHLRKFHFSRFLKMYKNREMAKIIVPKFQYISNDYILKINAYKK